MKSKSLLYISVMSALLGLYGSAYAKEGPLYTESKDFIGQTFDHITGDEGSGAVFQIYSNDKTGIVFNIKDSTFSNNSMSFNNAPTSASPIIWSYAGAIEISGGTTTIDNSIFTNNSAGQGGAISQAFTKKKQAATIVLSNSTFSENKANAGGAMSIMQGITISNTQFVGNTVIGDTDGGGALFLGAESNVVISDSLFNGNISKTSTGGAIATRQGDRGNNKDAKLEIVNTTFKNNTALADYLVSLTEDQKSKHAGRGGALQNAFYGSKSDPERVTITGSTFEANKAVYGGAILNEYKGSVAERVTKTAKISIAK